MTSPADTDTDTDADIAVVGAGPAGLAAAASALGAGASVVLLDAGDRAGGQYWRHGGAPDLRLYHGWSTFARLRHRTEPLLRTGHHVQTVVPDAGGWSLTCVVGDEPARSSVTAVVRARRLVLATGAYDRQLPFPGWDLPGVMAGGGVQALLKSHGVLAGRRVVVAGTGPFLLPVAAGLLAAGARVPLVAEAGSPAGLARHPRALASSAAKLGEGLGYAAQLLRHRTPYLRRHAVVRALGADRLEAVEVARLDRRGRVRPGTTRTVACDVLAVGWGFTPRLELPLQAGCATAIGADGSLVVAVDATQATSVAGVWAAGEPTGIGGADLAVVEGRIAGHAAAGAPVPRALLARRAALRRFAGALHAVHPVPRYLVEDLGDDVLACRCEEVPVSAVRDAVRELGATDARTVKLLTRTGMGWCQGRVCGAGVAAVTAHACGRAVTETDLGAFTERPLAAPATLGLLGGFRPAPASGPDHPEPAGQLRPAPASGPDHPEPADSCGRNP
ncbi:NAD(P)/FAD-dependent oxidoreductase [Dactylosporangium sp. CA-092794]|uniref:FAD/NAD(P)-dependent oxidoreductase n=1 Tax=Dactylosporangium sp. CA-092794 TaxID=3239929 RepID=UPI003D8BCF76